MESQPTSPSAPVENSTVSGLGSSSPTVISSSSNRHNPYLKWLFIGLFSIFIVSLVVVIIIKVYFPSLFVNSNKDVSPIVEQTTQTPTENPVLFTQPQSIKNTEFVNNVSKIFNTVNMESKNLTFAGVMFKYSGKIMDISKADDGMVTFTTDTKIEGVPNTWKFTSDKLTFDKSSTTSSAVQILNSNLKVGDNIVVAAIYMVKNKNATPQINDYALLHVERMN